MRTAYPLDSHTIDLHKHHDYFLLYVAFHTNKADVMNLVIYHQNITFDDLQTTDLTSMSGLVLPFLLERLDEMFLVFLMVLPRIGHLTIYDAMNIDVSLAYNAKVIF